MTLINNRISSINYYKYGNYNNESKKNKYLNKNEKNIYYWSSA